jgi:hypothetical protein
LEQYSPEPSARPSNPIPRRGLAHGHLQNSDDTPSPQRLAVLNPSGDEMSQDEEEEPMLSPSSLTPRRGQGSANAHADTPRPKTPHRDKYGLSPKDYDNSLSASSQKDNAPVHREPPGRITGEYIRERHAKAQALQARKTTEKPRNTIPLLRPPSALAVKTQVEVPGHWLVPLYEGRSPHVSPAADATRYRVAETRKFHGQREEEKKERHLFNKWITQTGEAPQKFGEEQTSEAEQEEVQEELVQSAKSGKPYDITSTVSDGEEEDVMRDTGKTSASSLLVEVMSTLSKSKESLLPAAKAKDPQLPSSSPSNSDPIDSSPAQGDTRLPFSPSRLPIETTAPAVRHGAPLPTTQHPSRSPSKVMTKDQSQRSAAPSSPERRQPAAKTPGMRKSMRIAQSTKSAKK